MKFSEFYEISRDVAVLEIEAIRLNWKGKKSAMPEKKRDRCVGMLECCQGGMLNVKDK